MTSKTCNDCKMNLLYESYKIELCPMHAATADLLAACEAVVAVYDNWDGGEPFGIAEVGAFSMAALQARSAIEQATGGDA